LSKRIDFTFQFNSSSSVLIPQLCILSVPCNDALFTE
jgi:hypothetical protein